MFDHLGLRVADLDASLAFFKAALEPLGFGVFFEDTTTAGLAAQDGAALWLHGASGDFGSNVHVAFAAPDRAAVETFHAAAIGAGGRDNGGPGLRPGYGEKYFAAFVIDPDGNNIEAVWMG